MVEADSGWIDCMDMETDLLEVDIQRSRSFLPNAKWAVTHRDPAWTSGKLVLEKENPFSTLNISNTEILNEQDERQPCTLCCKSRKFFCYSCHLPLASTKDHIPTVKLPVQIDIVKHPGEVEGKSTAVHAPILAPGHVKIHLFPDIPDYSKERALLVFPGKDSKSLEQICDNISISGTKSSEHSFPYDKIVFIDSTWNQCRKICDDIRINSLPRVVIESRQTMFWRTQAGKPKEYLATIEAIYYFCVDYNRVVLGKQYEGEYDNILFFFKFMYQKIHELYSE
eukprot:GFUD01003208.1.p1 GENE.GFUD01003208.1~~GFUD01003208.1.p1  ORF type:complete len:282 (+),score=66.40 GFUD01003208.1:51-896(+)